MAAVKSSGGVAEMLIRRGLHARGHRFRLGWNYKPDGRHLPGKPDLVFPRRRAVVFVNGCYWHGHACHLFRWPKTESTWWRTKLAGNVGRDRRVREQLRAANWRIGDVWECTLRGTQRRSLGKVLAQIEEFLSSDDERLVIGADQTVTISDAA